ncbi:MAG: ATP-binding protein [Scytonema sp. PMC 1069.18]|nr:ATP-binding protein [Scytonema sp. PMC 1069.18]
MFQKLSNDKDSDSTGIGLALVKKIVEIYEGNVWVKSEFGQGSTFFFTLKKYKAVEV